MSVPLPRERYVRQVVRNETGAKGQQKIAAATAVILGVGAFGSSTSELLAHIGVARYASPIANR
ncbi:MAG: hypothetical protein JOY71_31320 [Acetobacteraceae bacterium]|nr:hypothetical protein [Acetobacteraceae bacterium]